MKKKYIYYLFLILSTISISIISKTGTAQCDSDEFLDDCFTLLDDYTYVKSFDINIKKSDVEDSNSIIFSYVFSKDTKYLITVCEQNIEGNRMIIDIFDSNHNFITTSYIKSTQ